MNGGPLRTGAPAAIALLLLCAGHASAAAPCPPLAGDRPWLDRTASPECRADALVARLGALDAKLDFLAGDLQPYGLVEPRGSDGPAGPTRTPGAFSLPNGLTLASSFDPVLAREYGSAVGRQFRAAGLRQALGPTVDIARTWRMGRVPEALGEDPLLSGRIAAAAAAGAQGEGVAVSLKHFAAYVQEQGRTGDLPFGLHPSVDDVVSERALREIYLQPFRMAVEDGGALGVMCAFPRVNGTYACENAELLGVLKHEWGLRGTVTPDFPDGQRSVVAAVNAGLDNGEFGLPRPKPVGGGGGGPDPGLGGALGMGGPPGGVDLRTAVIDGRVPEARIDDMIRRRLVMIFAVGADESGGGGSGVFDDATIRGVAVKAAEAGAVLLRNPQGVLPLGPSVRSIAVIGAQAGTTPSVATQGSAFVEPAHLVTAIDAIRARAGAVRVEQAQGSLGVAALANVPAEALRTPDGAPGLRAEYFASPTLRFEGAPLAVETQAGVNIRTPNPRPGLPPNNGWSVRWTGVLTPRRTGLHNFTIAGAGSGRLFLDDRLAARFDRVDFGAVSWAAVELQAGRPVKVRVEFTPREAAPLPAMPLLGTTLGLGMRLGWAEPDDRIARAVEAARKADVAVVFAADAHGEGADRSELKLPGDQDALINAVAAANTRTVVVLNTAGPVSMPWASKVSAILEMWYPGDVFGTAASRLLFGDASPGGRLPITFPADEGQGPGAEPRSYPGVESADGSLDKVHLDEGLLVGYRWFDAKNQAPLFPFGFGLTYAPIAFDAVSLDRATSTVHVRLTNKGARPDSEVVQVYLGFGAAAHEPPRRLAAFQRVALGAGERRTVDIPLPPAAFQMWDENAHGWRAADGPYQVMVGRSSRDIVFHGVLDGPPSATTP